MHGFDAWKLVISSTYPGRCVASFVHRTWEIGVILGLAERTVNFHVYQAADKLGTRGRQSTVARAFTLGLVQP